MAADRIPTDGSGGSNTRPAPPLGGMTGPFALGPCVLPPPAGGPILEPEKTGKFIFRGGDLRWLLEKIKRLVDDLEQAMTVLPHVEEDGSSECHFADELYAKKEELEKQVKDAVQRMQDYDADLAREDRRLRTNQTQIQADGSRLQLPQTQDCYGKAESQTEKQCRELAQDRDAIAVVMSRALGVLQVSQRRKMPGREPRERFPVAVPRPGPAGSQSAGPGPEPLGKDLGGLLEMGPLGRAPGQK